MAAAGDDAAREAAREVMRVQCGACHHPSEPTHLARAMRVFNLLDEEWAGQMTERQRGSAIQRLRDRLTMTEAERAELSPRGVTPPPPPSERDVKLVESYLAARRPPPSSRSPRRRSLLRREAGEDLVGQVIRGCGGAVPRCGLGPRGQG